MRYTADGTLDSSFGGVDTLGNTVAFTEDGPAVTLDTNARIFDAELDALNSNQGDYAGASLTLSRQGGASAQDVFGFSPTGFTPEHVAVFASEMRSQLREGAVPFRKAYIRAVIDRVEVQPDEIRITGRRDVLERAVTSGPDAAPGVRSSVREWRARKDSARGSSECCFCRHFSDCA